MSKSFSSNHQLIRFACALDITNLCGIYSLNNSAIIIIGQYLANVIFSCLFLPRGPSLLEISYSSGEITEIFREITEITREIIEITREITEITTITSEVMRNAHAIIF